ncbi:MAG TPA: hypothetical protein VHN17_00505 [Steroidobacteraceae bacterium]|jgi:uncharacterized protein YegP (UPF0339 family)|nr:hypothetical protein [Steroidobacteraceae bacterium]
MDLTEPEPLPEMPEQSGEYRLRFRYELWSQASEDFRSRPAASHRFASVGTNGAANDRHQRAAEPDTAPDPDTVSAAGEHR